MTLTIGINGFGRIGRTVLRQIMQQKADISVVRINDIADLELCAYLFAYDSVFGPYPGKVEARDGGLIVDGHHIAFSNDADLSDTDLGGIDVWLECAGHAKTREIAERGLHAGASRVLISGPSEAADVTVVMGANEADLGDQQIVSNASCTTNAAGSPLQIMKDSVGVESALLNTIHSYTATQSIVDGPVRGGKDFRKGRAAAQNIIPSTTGSAIATTKAIPELRGRFDGIAVRVPTVTGSIVDITFIASRDTDVDEINSIFRTAAQSEQYKGLVRVEEDQVVSSDIIGDTHVAIIDPAFTKVVGRLVKILAWYDNEAGYSSALAKQVVAMGQSI